MSDGPSPHLTWKELACHDGTPYPTNWRESRAVVLAQEFEAIRHMCGDKPLVILSAYRTVVYNRKIGGAKYSQHKEGRALDLRPPAGMGVGAFHHRILQYTKTDGCKIRGLGLYPTFVHVDIRPTPALVRWSGGSPGA